MKTLVLILIKIYLLLFNLPNNTTSIEQNQEKKYVIADIHKHLKKKKSCSNLSSFVKLKTKISYDISRENRNTYHLLSRLTEAQKKKTLRRYKTLDVLFYSGYPVEYGGHKINWLVKDKKRHAIYSYNGEKRNEEKLPEDIYMGTSGMKTEMTKEQLEETNHSNGKESDNGDIKEQRKYFEEAMEKAEAYAKGKESTIIKDREKKKEQKVIEYMKEREKIFSEKPVDLKIYDILKYVYNEHVYINSKQLVDVIFRWMKKTYFDFMERTKQKIGKKQKKTDLEKTEQDNIIEREVASNLSTKQNDPHLTNTFFFKESNNETANSDEVQILKLYNKKNLHSYFFSFNEGSILKQLVTEGEDEEEEEDEEDDDKIKSSKKKKRTKKIIDEEDQKYDQEIRKTLAYPIFHSDEKNYIDKYRYMRSNVTIEFNIYDITTDTVILNNKTTNSPMLEFPLLNCHPAIQKCILTMKKLEKAIFYINNELLFKNFNFEYNPSIDESHAYPMEESDTILKHDTIQKESDKNANLEHREEEGNIIKKGENTGGEKITEYNTEVDEQRIYQSIKTEQWTKIEIFLCNIYEIDEQWLGITPEMFSTPEKTEQFLKEYSSGSSNNILNINEKNEKNKINVDIDSHKKYAKSDQSIINPKNTQVEKQMKQIKPHIDTSAAAKKTEQKAQHKTQETNVTKTSAAEINGAATNDTQTSTAETNGTETMSARQQDILKRYEEYEQKKELDIKTDMLLKKLENEMKYDPNHYMWKDLYPQLSEHHKKKTDKYFEDLKKEMSENKYSRGYAENIKRKQSLKGYDLGEKIEGKSNYYIWTESMHSFHLYIPLKYYVQKKDIVIDIDNTFFFLSIKNHTIVKDFFTHPINADESIWSFGDSSILTEQTQNESTSAQKKDKKSAANMELTTKKKESFPVYLIHDLDEEVKQIPKKYFCLIYHIYKDNNHKYMWGSVFKRF